MIDSFEAALRLDRNALHRVLQHGRPEERIWAVWALALGVDDGGELARRVTREPDVGVRRTLAVLLAGHGEIELLLALADTDPALAVRASAVQLVTRLAVGGRVPPPWIEAALSREPEIRAAILGAISTGAPPFLIDVARRLLRDRAVEIRFEAFEALLRVGEPSALAEAHAWMRTVSDVGAVCDHWLRASTSESLAAAYADAALETRLVVLERLRSPAWSAVEPLLDREGHVLHAALERADVAIPARVLARAILGGAHRGTVQRLTTTLRHAGRGHDLLAAIRLAIEGELDDSGAQLRTLARGVRDLADAMEIENAARVLDEIANLHPVEHLMGLENALVGWLARAGAPPDLWPLVPELLAYCRRRLAGLPAPSRRRGPRRRELPAAAGTGPEGVPWDEYTAFRELVAALEAVAQGQGASTAAGASTVGTPSRT